MAAHDRAKDHRTAAELRRAQAALAGAAGALLAIGLFGRAADVADAFCLVGAGAALGKLPIYDTRQDVAADRQAEDRFGQLDIADFLIVEIADGELHAAGPSAPSAAGSWDASGGGASPPSPRNAAGNGKPSWALRFAASLISTQPPLLPGTAPMIIRTPRSGSAEKIRRLCVVTRAAPRWPAIFLFLKVLPGSCR